MVLATAASLRMERFAGRESDELAFHPRARVNPILFRGNGGRMQRAGGDWRARARAQAQAVRRRAGEKFGNAVDADNAVTPGLRNEFVGAYMVSYEGLEKMLRRFAVSVVGSDKREELYAYPLTAPYPARQDRNRGPKIESFSFAQFRIPNYAWALRVPYHVDDVDDDLTGSLLPMARMAGDHFSTLDDRIFIQILTSGSDSELLPVTLTAPDGAALYASTDGDGNDRGGVSGGNILTGYSNPNAQDIRSLYQQMLARWTNFLDKKNQPLINPSIIKQGITIVHGPALIEEIKEAFIQRTVAYDSSRNDAASGVSNIILDSGEKVTTYCNPRLGTTSKALYAFLDGAPVKPIIKQARRELYEITISEQVSDAARDTNEVGNQYRLRMGWGLSPAWWYTLRATNAA